MLLPTSNSNCPIGFQNDFYQEVVQKTKFLTLKCNGSSKKQQTRRSKSADRSRFKFCTCTGPKKSRKLAKWYVKVGYSETSPLEKKIVIAHCYWEFKWLIPSQGFYHEPLNYCSLKNNSIMYYICVIYLGFC